MTFNQVLISALVLGAVQCMVIITITRSYRTIFEKHKATSYSAALRELAVASPVAAWSIRACYAAYAVELLLVSLMKSHG